MMLKSLSLIQALFVVLALTFPSHAQDAAAGEKVFKKCSACHKVGDGAKNGVGPNLNDVIGRAAGSVEGYKYGKDLLAAGEKGLVWTEELVAEFITDPKAYLRTYLDNPKAKSKMSFRLKDETDRADVVAYLASLSGEKAAESEDNAEAEAEAAEESSAPAEPELTVEEVIAAQEFSDEYLADPANIEAGKEIWAAQCTHCHGYKAYPGKAPKLKPNKYKPTFVFKRTYKGFKKMPAWRDSYSVDEIRQIVAYVKSSKFSP